MPPGKVVDAAITDAYDFVPGTLTVTKTIAGPAAGLQAPINILVDCGGPQDEFAMRIPAGAPAGPVPQKFYGIPAGSECTVTEIDNGQSDTIGVVGVGGGQKVTIGAGSSATADLTDTFTALAVPTTTTTTTAPVSTTTTTPSVPRTTTPQVTTTTSPSAVTTTTSAAVTTSTTAAVVTPTTSATTATTSSVTTTTPSQVTSTTVPTVTTTTSSSSVTLPETGAGAATPLLVELALAVMAAGGVLVAIAGRWRRPRTHGRHPKEVGPGTRQARPSALERAPVRSVATGTVMYMSEPSAGLPCVYCGGRHGQAAEVRACWERSERTARTTLSPIRGQGSQEPGPRLRRPPVKRPPVKRSPVNRPPVKRSPVKRSPVKRSPVRGCQSRGRR